MPSKEGMGGGGKGAGRGWRREAIFRCRRATRPRAAAAAGGEAGRSLVVARAVKGMGSISSLSYIS